MSYILEALKKAQAERQLGSVPTIDAVPAYSNAGPALPNKLLWLALLVLALLLGLLLWRQMEMRAPPLPTPALGDAPVAQVNAPPAVLKVDAAVPKAVEVPKAAPKTVAEAPVKPRQVAVAKPQPQPQPQPPAPVAAPEPAVPALRELPEPIQRQIPAIAIGGYIYSKNPADRLLLIDKSLRREGDELAPGLVLEKLQPAAAIFNYRGYRYRVPY
jgi:general secretion pathway protein B